MVNHSVVHDTFTLERHYDAAPERVFRAFADPRAKAQWFPSAPDSWVAHGEDTFDFRVGGRETSATGPAGGEPYHYSARYLDIVPGRRIVLSYEMVQAGRRLTVSLQTVELIPERGGTRLVLTEQGAYLDGLDTPGVRRNGIEPQLDALAKALAAG